MVLLLFVEFVSCPFFSYFGGGFLLEKKRHIFSQDFFERFIPREDCCSGIKTTGV